MITNIEDDLYQLIRHRSLHDSQFDISSDIKSYIASNEHRGFEPDLVTDAFNNLIASGRIITKVDLLKTSNGYYARVFAEINAVDKLLSQ